jgi:hypothetical protein
MLTIEECERVLVESIRADKELGPFVDDADQMVASGVVFMIDDQMVEPLRVELVLDASSVKVLGGSVFFGDKTRTAHGSRAVRKLRNAIIANPGCLTDRCT